MVYSKSVCYIWNPITTTLTSLSPNTTCRDIYVGVTCGKLDMMRSSLNTFHPTLSTYFFRQSTSLHFLLKIDILACLLFWCPLAIWNYLSFDEGRSVNAQLHKLQGINGFGLLREWSCCCPSTCQHACVNQKPGTVDTAYIAPVVLHMRTCKITNYFYLKYHWLLKNVNE